MACKNGRTTLTAMSRARAGPMGAGFSSLDGTVRDSVSIFRIARFSDCVNTGNQTCFAESGNQGSGAKNPSPWMVRWPHPEQAPLRRMQGFAEARGNGSRFETGHPKQT